MILKYRYEPEELKLLQCLHGRMRLSPKDYSLFLNLEKGFSGEKKFDELLEHSPEEWIILNDLLFDYSNTLFQIDSLLFTGGCIYLFEVKNYEGDFYIEQNRWYTVPANTEVKNPLLQLQRSESLLRRLLQKLGVETPLKALLIFINPEFQLYQATMNLPAIFPAQINRFIDKLKLKSQPANKNHLMLADKLLSLHLEDIPYGRRFEYTFEGLEKGVKCASCQHFMDRLHRAALVCKNCGYKEDVELAIVRSVKEFRVMFPDMMLTTNIVHEWCSDIISKKKIRKILSNNFNHIIHGKTSYFE
ncbi:nuclease-related domain-containing protein [Cytobacillus oceanisediminis]|uniref:nuclease-related domain-containing protein n=1 Tax=Cytobacillus oceanisediminis TaxID=665099 RepID=UPI001C245D12|nr:nuclease-related domain-containing protein [Cytobacillus oceanisediminis]MBY0159996.1 NERD domain-containing protein [Cytobacillus firmus]MBU8732725.1 NERD domain-containing protein [Cytobacillus oceanisediminis]MCM3396072.1 NERD domain-containing protein [Cytobacillus oceanisediminis]MCM3528681.1 NERD domain-containing protein [Cytobacillus oceanisediminis]USK45524.1 NERD domain-containing protein [Cytobacillus oceanisediminis]